MKRNNPTIKAVIFDIGNVLVFYNHHIAAKEMSKLINASESKIFDVLHGEKIKKISKMRDLGISSKKYWTATAKILKVREIPYKKFDELWNTIFWPNKKLFSLLKRLKEKYKTATISNTPATHKRYFIKKYGIGKYFDSTVYSCDVKLLKPNPRIYRVVLRKFGVKPEETLFIDDKIENVKGAKKIGINAIHFKSNRQLLTKLKKLGIKY